MRRAALTGEPLCLLGNTGWSSLLGKLGLIPSQEGRSQYRNRWQTANPKLKLNSLAFRGYFSKLHLREKRPLASSGVTAAQTKEMATKLHQPAFKDFPRTFQVTASVVYEGKGRGKDMKEQHNRKRHNTKTKVPGVFISPERLLLGQNFWYEDMFAG